MRKIYKQVIDIYNGAQVSIKVPVSSKIISCGFQKDDLVVWYMFDPLHDGNLVDRSFYIVRTGEASPDFIDSIKLRFIGTAQTTDNLPFVLHVFEILTPPTNPQ